MRQRIEDFVIQHFETQFKMKSADSSSRTSEDIFSTKFNVIKILRPLDCTSDKLDLIRELVVSNPHFNKEQRNLFLCVYRDATLPIRNGLRMLTAIEEQQKQKGNLERSTKINELILQLEVELFTLCNEVEEFIDKHLLPPVIDTDSKAFYYKMKADFYRYWFEFAKPENKEEFSKKADEFYQKAVDVAHQFLPGTSVLSLNISLNYSVFLYEVKNQKKMALDIAQHALDESGILVNEDNEEDFAEATTTQRLLRENITIWTRDEGD